MKVISHLLIVLATTLVVACGGASSKADQAADLMEDMTAVLKDVKDEASAKSAKSEIESLMTKMTDLSKGETMSADDPTATLSDDEEKRFEAVSTAFGEEMGRVLMDPKLSAILGDAMTPKMGK